MLDFFPFPLLLPLHLHHYTPVRLERTMRSCCIRSTPVIFTVYHRHHWLCSPFSSPGKKETVIDNIATAARNSLAAGAEVSQGDLNTFYSAETGMGAGVPSGVADPNFNNKVVSTAHSVFTVPNSVNANSAEIADVVRRTYNLDDTFISNVANVDSDTKWQYFASQNAVTRVYPGFEWDRSCDGSYSDYDPRIRPWFVLASSGPKDIVILIDKSGSMGQYGRMDKAIEAAQAVISTSSANDYISVVQFSSTAGTPACFPSRLVRATSDNKQALKDFVGDLRPSGGTDFQSAFTKAFDLIDSTRGTRGTNCQTVIVFLTDGDAEDPSSIISARNTQDIGATIFSFTLGSGASVAVPSRIAEENNGLYSHIDDNGDLLTEMAFYYKYLAYGIQSTVMQWTAPYIDSWGLGLMITGAKGVYSEADSNGYHTFLGVAAADVVLPQLLSVVQSYNLESMAVTTYSFIVNEDGEALVHPLQKSALSTTVGEPIYTSIDELEGSEFQAEDMRSLILGTGTSIGGRQLQVNRALPRGDISKEGLTGNSYAQNLVYFYQRIATTPFFIGLVIDGVVSNPGSSVAAWNVAARKLKQLDTIPLCNGTSQQWCKKQPQLYHRIDLSPTDTSPFVKTVTSAMGANQPDGALITENAVGWVAAPTLFSSPEGYLSSLPLTANQVLRLNEWASTGTATNMIGGNLPSSSHQVLMLASGLAESWQEAETSASTKGIWTYVGFSDGLALLYPGTPISNEFYDPRARSWYLRGVAEDFGASALSTPYLDAFGAGAVLTLSSSIREGGQEAASGVYPIGVAGFDFSVTQFASAIGSLSPDCSSSTVACYLVDRSGYIVSKESFASLSSNADENSYSYLFFGDTSIEPAAFAELYCAGHIVVNTTRSYVAEATVTYYTLKLSSPLSMTIDGNGCTRGTLYASPVARSNVFFIAIDGSNTGCLRKTYYAYCSGQEYLYPQASAQPFVSEQCANARQQQCGTPSSTACLVEEQANCAAERQRVTLGAMASRQCPSFSAEQARYLVLAMGSGSSLSVAMLAGIIGGGAAAVLLVVVVAIKVKGRRSPRERGTINNIPVANPTRSEVAPPGQAPALPSAPPMYSVN
uniref:VWFA domain-containing protein n=1 Tax=Palpitomonas bilix TaxID=652834 RepID=A0A7S3GFG5_9EUKA|mmetsp:Transcript_47154/g.121860  ORF Transcript_47154/g.121860 Transcript_47154/m.121860 type:complete len:1102 (+) Transcript_47154:425-3730(+)